MNDVVLSMYSTIHNMLLLISRLWLYAALFTPILLTRSLFFPFITSKQIAFRVCTELALAFFIIEVLRVFFGASEEARKKFFRTLKHHLLHPVSLTIVAFGGALILSSLLSDHPALSFWSNYERGDGSFQIAHYIVFALLIKILFTEAKTITRFFWAQIIASIPVSFYAIGQMFGNKGSATFLAAAERVSGTLGNPSYLACYLAFNLAFILFIVLRTKDRLVHIGLGLLGLIQLFLILKAQTLGVGLGLFVGGIVLGIFLMRTSEHAYAKKVGLAVIGSIAIFSALFFATRQQPFWKGVPLLSRLTNLTATYEGFRPRLWTWASTMQGALDNPLFGWGTENFAEPFDTYYNPNHYGHESFFDRTHNVALEYLISGGIIAFIPWCLIFFYYYRSLRHKKRGDLWTGITVAMPVVYLVQGMFLFDVLPIYLTLSVFIMCVLNLNDEHDEKNLEPVRVNTIAPLHYVTLSLTGVVFLFLGYTTAALPLQRNMLISDALRAGGLLMYQVQNGEKQLAVTPAQVVSMHQLSIAHPSPIGRIEAIEMYQRFILDLVGLIEKIPNAKTNEAARVDMLRMVDELNDTFDHYKDLAPGIKNSLVNAGINARVGIFFGSLPHVERSIASLEKDLLQAPHRIELVHTVLQIAQQTNNQQLWDRWAPRATELRPDLFTNIVINRQLKDPTRK